MDVADRDRSRPRRPTRSASSSRPERRRRRTPRPGSSRPVSRREVTVRGARICTGEHEPVVITADLGGSQSVRGIAPIRMKAAVTGRSFGETRRGVPQRSRSASRCSPRASTISVLVRTTTFPEASISRTRYSDMVSSIDGPRTTSVTLLAKRHRWTAACPAELAPPTTITSSPRIAGASEVAAP